MGNEEERKSEDEAADNENEEEHAYEERLMTSISEIEQLKQRIDKQKLNKKRNDTD